MVHLRIVHAKNQPPRPKTVAYRRITDRHTHTQTHRHIHADENNTCPKTKFLGQVIISNGSPKDPSCQKSAPQAKNCGLQAANRQTDRQTDRQRKQTLRTPFSIFFLDFGFYFKGAVRKSDNFTTKQIQCHFLSIDKFPR